MDTSSILHFLSESAFMLFVLLVFMWMAIFYGRQTLINIICGLYFALLLTMQFPYFDVIFQNFESASLISGIKLALFITTAILTTMLFKRIMPQEYQEKKFESFHKKIALALSATVLVMIFSFNVLPVTEFLTPGTPIQSLFAPEQFFFWWLMFPIVVLVWN